MSVILCCMLVMLIETCFYVSWLGGYGLFLWTSPTSELMVWKIGVIEDSEASYILSVVCCCWCTAAPSTLSGAFVVVVGAVELNILCYNTGLELMVFGICQVHLSCRREWAFSDM